MKFRLLFFLLPFLTFAQIDKSLQYKVAIMQNFVKMGNEGETAFWQTKGKITFAIVNYTDAQNPVFRDLFISQYRELYPIYTKMVKSEDDNDTHLFVKTLIRHEEDYRKLLSKEQLLKYSEKMDDMEKNNPEAYFSFISLFFSDKLLKEYKSKF